MKFNVLSRFFFFLTLLFISSVLHAQFKKVSRTTKSSEYDRYTKKWTEKFESSVNRYITWEKGEVTIICPSCDAKATKNVFAIVKKISNKVSKKPGLTYDLFDAIWISGENTSVSILAYYTDDNVDSIVIMFGDNAMELKDLEDM